jgi:hypothetical protein
MQDVQELREGIAERQLRAIAIIDEAVRSLSEELPSVDNRVNEAEKVAAALQKVRCSLCTATTRVCYRQSHVS